MKEHNYQKIRLFRIGNLEVWWWKDFAKNSQSITNKKSKERNNDKT